MDHRISKDMISSGMTPSGEKTQADLGRTQYGSVPSPNTLMDAYKTIYEHHQKDKDGNTIPHEGEQLNEGKMPEGLKNYLMKKKGKKDVKEGYKGTADLSKSHPEALKKVEDNIAKHFGKPKKKDKKEDVDLFDLVKSKLIDEGFEEKDAVKIMANLTEDEFNQISEGIAGMALKTGMAVGGALLAKKGIGDMKKKFNNFLNKQRNTSPIGGNTRPGADKIEYGK